jgi:hypothetical protein
MLAHVPGARSRECIGTTVRQLPHSTMMCEPHCARGGLLSKHRHPLDERTPTLREVHPHIKHFRADPSGVVV